MNIWWTFFARILVLALPLLCIGVVIINDVDPGQCDKSNHGTQVLVRDRENKEQVLICSWNDGSYQWKTLAGDDPIGEIFSPAYDCSNILDSHPDAKDGTYWINLGGYYPKQVYCDMTTDGGGFILVGRKNNSKTWTVPSNDYLVEPKGDPHWASNLGDAAVLDFRVQIATAEDFKHTKADWSFRLQSERPLKELMIDDHGCSQDQPGIGNIAYVKDIQTETIVSTKYRCSIFGKYQHPLTGFGWHKMNSCLNKPCKSGYAYLDHPTGASIQVDFHGSFSFSVSGNHSGVFHDATAFVGCSQNQMCCGCFGPVGGTDDYCRPNCTAKSGGTVEKHTYTWFWVRTSLPKRVWNRCMEYKEENDNGDIISYRLLDGNITPEQGRCPKDTISLNEGIVVVPDGEAAKKVPAIPGLLQYRKDSKELYLRANETWKVLAPEKKILKKTYEMFGLKLKDVEQKLYNHEQRIIQEDLEVDSKLNSIDEKLSRLNQTVQIIEKKYLFYQECKKYTLFDNKERNINYRGGSVGCDSISGWYRFDGAAGTQLPTSCVPRDDTSIVVCETHAVSWLNGAHPSIIEGKVTRQVCFSWGGNCCAATSDIEVINCGSFYIYNLVSLAGWCHRRYCGT